MACIQLGCPQVVTLLSKRVASMDKLAGSGSQCARTHLIPLIVKLAGHVQGGLGAVLAPAVKILQVAAVKSYLDWLEGLLKWDPSRFKKEEAANFISGGIVNGDPEVFITR